MKNPLHSFIIGALLVSNVCSGFMGDLPNAHADHFGEMSMEAMGNESMDCCNDHPQELERVIQVDAGERKVNESKVNKAPDNDAVDIGGNLGLSKPKIHSPPITKSGFFLRSVMRLE